MPVTTLSSRQFNQDSSRAKKAANTGPVFITDRGQPAHVLLTFEAYKKLTRMPTKIADLLAMPEVAYIEFEFERSGDLARAADLS